MKIAALLADQPVDDPEMADVFDKDHAAEIIKIVRKTNETAIASWPRKAQRPLKVVSDQFEPVSRGTAKRPFRPHKNCATRQERRCGWS